MAKSNSHVIFSLALLFCCLDIGKHSVISESTEEEPNSRNPKPSFLSLFTSCTVHFVGDFSYKDSQSKGETDEKEKYLHFFLQQSPLQFRHVTSRDYSETLSSYNPEFGDLRKYSGCSLKFYFLFDLISARGGINFEAFTKLLKSSIVQGENPEYIVFVKTVFGEYKNRLHGSLEHSQSEKSFYANLYRLTLTSKFFVIDGPQKIVSMLCLHCSVNYVMEPLGPSDFESLDVVEAKWRSLHSNLNQRSVEIYRRRESALSQPHKCAFLNMIHTKVTDGVDQDLCTIIEISRAMNVTPYPTDHRLYGHVKHGVMMYEDYMNKMFFTNPSAKYLWSTTAESFELFSFLAIHPKRINLHAVWRPFQRDLWIAIWASCIGLSVLFGFSIGSRYEIARTHFINAKFSFLHFIAIILEQKQLNIWKIRKLLSNVSIVLVTTWAVVALHFSSLYKSSIYSVLATILPPPAPTSLMSLAVNGSFLLTTTSLHAQGEQVSPFLGILDEKIAYNDSHVEAFQTLKERTHFAPARPALLMKKYEDMLTSFRRHFELDDPVNTSYVINVPRDFVLIGPDSELRIVAQLFTVHKKYIFVLKNPSAVSTFVNRTPWIVRRNFLYPLLQARLASLFESGLYQEWKNAVLLRQLEEEWVAAESIESDGSRSTKNHVLELASRESDPELHSEPWPVAAFATVMIFWVFCIDLCLLVFSSEWVAIVVLRSCFNIRRNAVRHMKIDDY